MLNRRTTELLGLTSTEGKIVKSLYSKSLNISTLANLCKVPRTTLYTAITSLEKRGLIQVKTLGKSRLVSLREDNRLIQINQFLAEQTSQSPFTFIYGKTAMFGALEKLYSQKNVRVYAIQPTASLSNILAKFHANAFIPINELLKKNHVIVDAIIKEDSLTTYLNLYKGDELMQNRILKSFHGRMNSSTFVNKKYLNCNSEITFDHKEALLFNWKSEVGIRISNKDMLDFLRELFEFAKGYGKKDDLNRVVAEKMQALLQK